MNGLALRKMRVGSDIKTQISGFEVAAIEFEPTMKAVREFHIEPHNKMKQGKLRQFQCLQEEGGTKGGRRVRDHLGG